MSGSSPLTRGKLHRHITGELQNGLIPAHAGKTDFADLMHESAQAHPRSRGENGGGEFMHNWAVGSSPLTRGKRVREVR